MSYHKGLLNSHRGFTFFSDEPNHKGRVHLPLSDSFMAEAGAFTTTVWGTTHKGLGAPKQQESVTKTTQSVHKGLGSPKEILARISQLNEREMRNSLVKMQIFDFSFNPPKI